MVKKYWKGTDADVKAVIEKHGPFEGLKIYIKFNDTETVLVYNPLYCGYHRIKEGLKEAQRIFKSANNITTSVIYENWKKKSLSDW